MMSFGDNDLNLMMNSGKNDKVDDGTSSGGTLSERLLGSSNDDNPNNPFARNSHIGIDPETATVLVQGGDVTNENNNIVVHQLYQGEKQTNQYRDVWAAVLFVGQLIAILYLAFAWGIRSLNYSLTSAYDNGLTPTSHHYGGIFRLCLLSSIIAIFVSFGVLTIITHHAQKLVEYSLVLSVGIDFMLLVYCIIQRSYIGIGISLLVFVVGILYASRIWRRIPFAASNLETALTAVRTNGGITLVALGITTVVNIVFMSLWLLAWLGVYVRYTAKSCQNQQSDNDTLNDTTAACLSHMNPFVVILFLLSYYWTSEVGKSIIHVTVSGVVGTWWFAPDEAVTFLSPAIYDSLARSTTFSFGSICLGSLVTATLQLLHTILNELRRHGRSNQMILCILECLTSFLHKLVKYFNKWAYVYIGLYGYDYLTAGRKVMDLFRARGWTALINDDLVTRVLQLLSIVIGILTGCVALVLSNEHTNWLIEFNGTTIGPILAFIIPFIIGLSISTIIMGVVSSAVDTVIVAFCEAPLEFERNHPGLHRQMITSYSLIYPDESGFAGGSNQQTPL